MQTTCILSAPIFLFLYACNSILSVFLCCYQNLVLIAEYHVYKHCSDICCDEFQVPQIDRKTKPVKTVTCKILFATSTENKSLFIHRKYQNLWMNNKVKGDKYVICLYFLAHLLNICRQFEFLIFQGNVATYLR